MSERIPSDEWKESSDWDDIVGWNGGYILGVGYCYAKQFTYFFNKHNKNYHFFQTKWGRCGTTFLFSALRPDSIIVPVAWANASTICKSTEILFRIWNEILKNLSSINAPMLIIDFPAAWHKSILCKDNGLAETEEIVRQKRKFYYDNVIVSHLNNKIHYIDLYDYVPMNSNFIHENEQLADNEYIDSPWHIRQSLINNLGKNFLSLLVHNDQNIFVSELKQGLLDLDKGSQ
jgi:hypothetical protein